MMHMTMYQNTILMPQTGKRIDFNSCLKSWQKCLVFDLVGMNCRLACDVAVLENI